MKPSGGNRLQRFHQDCCEETADSNGDDQRQENHDPYAVVVDDLFQMAASMPSS